MNVDFQTDWHLSYFSIYVKGIFKNPSTSLSARVKHLTIFHFSLWNFCNLIYAQLHKYHPTSFPENYFKPKAVKLLTIYILRKMSAPSYSPFFNIYTSFQLLSSFLKTYNSFQVPCNEILWLGVHTEKFTMIEAKEKVEHCRHLHCYILSRKGLRIKPWVFRNTSQ